MRVVQRIGRPPGALDSHRAWHDLDDSWQTSAACHNSSPEVRRLFFSENDSSRVKARLAEQEAKAICLTCTVQVTCLEYALAGDMHGIWGGMTQREREQMMKGRRTGRVRGTRPTTSEIAQ